MNMKEYIDEAEKDLLHTYNRYQIVWDKGDGVHLYDLDGREYLDFVSGIAVFALGYNNKAYNDALKAQIDKVFIHPTIITMYLRSKLQERSRRYQVWTEYSLPTVVQKQSKERLRLQENMHTSRMAQQIMRSLP